MRPLAHGRQWRLSGAGDRHGARRGGCAVRRIPYQATPEAREAVNERRIAYLDRHVGPFGEEVVFDQLVDPDVAVVEAVAVGPDWLVPSGSLGHTPAFVEGTDRLVVELDLQQ